MFKVASMLLFVTLVFGTLSKQAGAEPVRVSGAVAAKLEKQRFNVDGRYLPPPMARSGVVLLEFTVEADGTVADIKNVSEGTVMGPLVNASTKSLSQWIYNPYVVNGKPTAMRATIRFKFSYPGGIDITYP